MKYSSFPIFFFLLLLSSPLPAQPIIEWQKCLGGSDYEEATSVCPTNDDGFVVMGLTSSVNGDVTGNHGGIDFWVVKLDKMGTIQWKKALGGSNNEWGYCIRQTSDGGYIVAGDTRSNNGDVSGFHGNIDAWVVKLSSAGIIQWQRALGGSNWDDAWSVEQTSDGGYILAGRSNSNDGDVTGNHGFFDFWVVKLSGAGILEWQKSLGGSGEDTAFSVRQTPDGGYVVAGASDSDDGDASGLNGSGDYWVVKLNSVGDLEWQKMLGSTSLDRANDIHPTSDGGYVVVGITSWSDGDVTGNHGGYDYWVAKLNSTGDIQWEKSLGGSDEDFGQSIKQTSDNGYIVAGFTRSEDGDVSDNDGGQDAWIVKLSEEGEIQWEKAMGGTQAERARSIDQANDNGYIIAGYSWSNDGDVSGNHGGVDFWVVKLSPESSAVKEPAILPLEIAPNPASTFISLKILTEESPLAISITNVLGQKVWQQVLSSVERIDIDALPNGQYFLNARDSSGRLYAGRFEKQE